MAFLELKNIGKIYVSENSVAVGIRGVNLDFNIGEFVAVTGKSGSGKTTLLNCISGMDSYEEGELYVNGEPTSHYTQSDWEEYRQKYISFVFQDYNIIDSFTVLQNVELALTHIESHKERRRRALELIDRVGMTSHKNSKGSKLSGGQKQRTVIARALAKDSPIILADEPTGNLDSKTSEEIVQLLHEISKDKLVIVVTHSFSQFESVATRQVRIFDGGVERDEIVVQPEKKEYVPQAEAKGHKRDFSLGLELGWHKFFASPKLSVFMCIIMLVAMLGSFFVTALFMVDSDYDTTNSLFAYKEGRLVISKEEGGTISETELQGLQNSLGAKSYMQYDYLLDKLNYVYAFVGKSNSYINTTFRFSPIEEEKPDVGRLPESDGECMLCLPIYWQPIYGKDTIEKDTITLFRQFELSVVGVKYYYDNTTPYSCVYLTQSGFENFANAYAVSELISNLYIEFTSGSDIHENLFDFSSVRIDYTLKDNEYYMIGEGFSHFISVVADENLKVEFSYMLNSGEDKKSFTLNPADEGWNFIKDKCTDKDKQENEYGYYDSRTLVVSENIMKEFAYKTYNSGYTQASLFFESDKDAENAKTQLDRLGYVGIVSNERYETGEAAVLKFVTTVMNIVMWVLCILFFGFFLSLCSRRAFAASNGDFAILRSMGINTKIVKISMYVRTFIATLPSIIILGVVAPIIYLNPMTNQYVPFMHVQHYAILIVGLILLNFIVAGRCNKRIFKGTVIKNLRGGDRV